MISDHLASHMPRRCVGRVATARENERREGRRTWWRVKDAVLPFLMCFLVYGDENKMNCDFFTFLRVHLGTQEIGDGRVGELVESNSEGRHQVP